jgi:uncharacterized membrane protein
MKKPPTLFTVEQRDRIVAAINRAERTTSTEIRVHIENRCIGEVMGRAVMVFEQLEMHRTKLRNGVLIYLALQDRKAAIIGDVAINACVGEGFWKQCYATLSAHLSKGEFTEGICTAIDMLRTELKPDFPHHEGDTNELPDDISFGR